MPAREYHSVLYDMPVDTLLLGASPPGLRHYFAANPASYYHRLPPRSGFNMGIGMKGDLLQQLQRDNIRSPLRPCIKVRTPLTNGTSRVSPSDTTEHRRNISDGVPKCSTKNGVRLQESPERCIGNVLVSRNRISSGAGNDKKRVSFADSKGLSLQTVKYMDGPSNTPPKLHIHLLQDVIQNEEAKPTHPYTYVPGFEQPASNYLRFRDRLEKECVCLENVMIKDNITVVGTVKVKNVAFEKSVVVRTTFDDWKTHKDLEANYVASGPASNSHDKFDTFSFKLDIPPNLSGRGFEFCLRYTTNQQTFWDSNSGNNYKIVTEKNKEYVQNQQQNSIQALSGSHEWGQFSYWQVGQEERPYW